MKLELKHIIPYLRHGLKIKKVNGFIETLSVYNTGEYHISVLQVIQGMGKPILIPLEALITKLADWLYIYHTESFDDLDVCKKYIEIKLLDPNELPFSLFDKCCELNGDVFSLIEQGLAIDINQVS